MDPIIGYIATGVISLTVGLLLQFLKSKPRLKYFLPGTFLFQINEPRADIRTDSLTIENFGLKTATNIEIIHKDKPDHFQFSQAIGFSESTNPDGSHITKIPSLGPKEHVNIQYLSHAKAPVLLNIRSDSGTAKQIQVRFLPVFPMWFNVGACALTLVGLGTTAYGLYTLGMIIYGIT
ncbi:hypothetical protein NO559_07010 [Dasania sp. GY-MA-18]|uniref:Uncharacterized protein n=1 Tax=Dasania phycosphaerae TaxID=2950436 RepID=A0A9J6RL66_9GAMM|nr:MULTISPECIES: hypothetical protein [Dasania]MCR8922516.1 hypothetical protein [Dasania sp. GY-MA-18]MCZ0864944.1 hypothetical protein [Dasania phycosphaerae]MCZ0868672.1 hypothetical protein [Dasania phycosphaerae]